MKKCETCNKEKPSNEMGILNYYDLDEPLICKQCIKENYGEHWNPFTGSNDYEENK